MTAGIGVASRFHRVLDKWLGQYPAAARPHIDGVIAQINADGTARVRKPGHQYASAYNYALPVPDPTRPWKVGDPVQLDESNGQRPRISTVPLPAVVTDQRFVVSASNPTLSWYTGGHINLRTQFNADPTGANDALTAWNAALASIPFGGWTVLWLDPGIYTFSGPITIPANVLLLGPGRMVTTVRITSTGTTPCITIGSDNCGIRGITVNNNAGGSSTVPTIHVNNGTYHFMLRDIGFDGSGSGQGTGLEMATGASVPTAVLEDLCFNVTGTLSAQLTGAVTADNCDFAPNGFGNLSVVGATRARLTTCRCSGSLASNFNCTISGGSTTVTLVDCDIPSHLVVDNSSQVLLLGTPIGGNLTEQNGATNNRYYDSPVTGSTTLLGGSRRRGASGSASDPALSIDVPSGFTPDLINAKSGTFRVLPSGDVTHGWTPVTIARAVNGAALIAGTTYTYSIAGSYGVPSGARAVWVFAQTSAGTAGNGLIIGPSGALPTSATSYQSSTLDGKHMLIPLSAGGQIDVKPVTTGCTFYLDVEGYVL